VFRSNIATIGNSCARQRSLFVKLAKFGARARLGLVLVALTGPAAGCTINQYPVSKVPPIPVETASPSLGHEAEPEYRIQAGDALDIQSYYDPALKQMVTVRPDGRISLILLGDVQAAGKSSADLDQELKHAYWDRLPAHPDITVTVDAIAAQVVYVGGEVKAPAIEQIKGSLTLLQSIMVAGGYLPSANQAQVIIVRQEAAGQFHAYQQNASLVLNNQTSEVSLKPHDIVFVPKTSVARLDQAVDQYINGVVPQAFKFNFGYVFNDIAGSTALTH
jgi:protein involved in polysaccharide export with SLBB domain